MLSCNEAHKEQLKEAKTVCLTYEGQRVAMLSEVSLFPHRKEERCARQFGLNHKGHPYQKYIYEECGDWLIGGDLHVFQRVTWNDGLDEYRLTPEQLRLKFKEMNVRKIINS